MLKFFIEISSIITSFILIVFIMTRIPKEIIGLKENSKTLNDITLALFSISLTLFLIFLNRSSRN